MSLIFSLIVALVSFLVTFTRINSVMGERNQKTVKIISLFIGILATFASLSQIIVRLLVIVPTGNVGVVELFGKLEPKPLQPGIHLQNPLSKITKFSTRLKDIKETVTATSREGLNLDLDVSLQYRLEAEKAVQIYQDIGINENDIVISRFRSTIREITAIYDASAVYGDKRQEVTDKLQSEMVSQLSSLGFVVEEVLLRNVILPEKIKTAIESKLEAQQQSQQQQFINEKERQAIEFALEKAKKEAERKKIEAQGIADSQKLLTIGLTEQLLKLKAIEATQKLAESPNSKIIIIGGGKDNLPLILQQGQ